jgi:hypothetical protein
MTLKRRIVLVRWLLICALAASAYCTSRGALLVYFMRPTADVSIFKPATAEDVGRRAEPFQSNTRETNGLFRIVQQQHIELATMYSRLETAAELNWSLAVLDTVVLAVLTCLFAASLALVWGIERSLLGA